MPLGMGLSFPRNPVKGQGLVFDGTNWQLAYIVAVSGPVTNGLPMVSATPNQLVDSGVSIDTTETVSISYMLPGADPTTPSNGDFWLNAANPRVRLGGATWNLAFLEGVTSGAAAVAGQKGEVISSTVSAVAVAATGTVGNVTSISLTAGDWLISGLAVIAGGATGLTSGSTAQASIVTTTATNGTAGSTMAQQSVLALLANGLTTLAIPAVRVNISSTTTYYFTEQVSFVAGSPTVSGTLTATRMR
jgi:hypothetical protein